jgi:hypothetical protein
MSFTYRAIGWSYALVCATIALNAPAARVRPRATTPTPTAARPRVVTPPAPRPPSTTADAAEWFRRVKPYCNSVEVSNVERDTPAPKTVEGTGYNAACLALAGRIDDARRAIDALSAISASDRPRAANIVFEIGHPVADAGDDRSAGAIMELVVDYIPNHYMALYHAGMAEYMLGQRDLSRRNLTEFLRYYSPEDGWRHNAQEILRRLDDPASASADPRRPREP